MPTTPQGEEPAKEPQRPRMQPTSLATLAVAALASAAIAWLAISRFYGVMPDLPWLPPATFFGLAIVEAITAPSTKARIDRREGTTPVNPLIVARYVVLAKASALAGAIFTGLYGGMLVWLLAAGRGLSHASADLPKAVAGLLSAVALVVAALWLERSCRVPPPPRTPPGTASRNGRVDSTENDWRDEDRADR
jgi:Protein of unknown function (DUF3180)